MNRKHFHTFWLFLAAILWIMPGCGASPAEATVGDAHPALKDATILIIRHAEKPNDGFELAVTNRGEPIPCDAIERLFQPFSRNSGRPDQQGLGLGLFIAAEIARTHDGSLTVASSSAETRFTFHMPLQAKLI